MKRKGFCILFIKHLIIKVFLTRCVWCDSRLFKGLATPSTPRWAATLTVWPAILSSRRPLSHTSLWDSVGSCCSWGLHKETEDRSQFLSWAGELRQQQPLELVLRQHPPPADESNLGEEMGGEIWVAWVKRGCQEDLWTPSKWICLTQKCTRVSVDKCWI